jgi:hypothetical protein
MVITPRFLKKGRKTIDLETVVCKAREVCKVGRKSLKSE